MSQLPPAGKVAKAVDTPPMVPGHSLYLPKTFCLRAFTLAVGEPQPESSINRCQSVYGPRVILPSVIKILDACLQLGQL